MIGLVPEIVHGREFLDQMSRFIPLDVQQRTLLNENFLTILQNETVSLLTKAKGADSRVGQ